MLFLGLDEDEEGDDENGDENDCTNLPKPDRRGARTAAVTFGIAVACISLARLDFETRRSKQGKDMRWPFKMLTYIESTVGLSRYLNETRMNELSA